MSNPATVSFTSAVPNIPSFEGGQTVPGAVDDAISEVDLESLTASRPVWTSARESAGRPETATLAVPKRFSFFDNRASKVSCNADAVKRRSRYQKVEETGKPKKARQTVQRVMTMTLERESNSGVKDPVVDMLGRECRDLRRGFFEEVGQLVGTDEDGWPSCSTFVAEKKGFGPNVRCGRRYRPEYHPIEQFQRDCIAKHLLVTTLRILNASNIKWRYIRIYLKRKFCCCVRRKTPPPASKELIEHGLDDGVFCQIFEESWGCDMLRPPHEGENTYGVPAPVVVDTGPWLKGLEVREGLWLEPSKIIFTHDEQGVRPAVIVTEGDDQHEALVSLNPEIENWEWGTGLETSSEDQWLWAKRMAITACISVHQICFHLCHHLSMEGVMCCCYSKLSPEHYVFKILEPLCGDVGFLNQSWGIELITGVRDPGGKAWALCIADVLPLTGPALYELLARGKKLLPLGHQFPFDEEDGCYRGANCGVAAGANLPVRSGAQKVYQVFDQFVEEILKVHWRKDDKELEMWWNSIFWGLRAPKARKLTRTNVAHIIATFMMQATYCHDLAHNRWVYINHMYHVTFLYRGDMSPESYLPDDDSHIVLRAMLAGLMGDDLETPLTCYDTVFPECKTAVENLSKSLKKIQARVRHIDKFGSMTH